MDRFHAPSARELTDEQKQLIRDSYVTIARREYSTGEMFYERLFEIAPEFRSLFPNEMKAMRLKFIQAIGSVVNALELNEDVRPGVEELGQRHLGYGVKQEHYQKFGEAFIWAVGQVLGDKFTPEVKAAWEALYHILADMIFRSAYP